MTSKEESNIVLEHIFSKKFPSQFKEYVGIKTKLETTLRRINDLYYSEHGLEHCDKILRNIDHILPFDIKDKMRKNELFCLLCSILLHDIGRINQNEPYESFRETNRDHARRSCDWIIKNGRPILGLAIPYILPISCMCLGHGDVEEAENKIKGCYEEGIVSIDDEEIDILFLISLLRLGDVLDIGFWRVPEIILTSLWEIPQSEIRFILKDYLTNAVIIDPIEWRIRVTLRRPSNIDDTLFSEIKANLIKSKCEEVLNSAMKYLKRRDIHFRSIDIHVIKSGHEEAVDILNGLLEMEGTEETHKKITAEYEERVGRGGETLLISKPQIIKREKPISTSMSHKIFSDGGGEVITISSTISISEDKTNKKEAI